MNPQGGAGIRLDDSQRLAWLRLIRSENIGPATFRDLINHFGSGQRAIEAVPELAARGGRRIRLFPLEEAEAELDAVDRFGARLVAMGEPDYPPWLRHIPDAPPLVTVRGELSCMTRACVAIVGSRNASVAGRKVAATLARQLGEHDYVLASGLARGIDAAAHAAALDGGTIAVLAGGIDKLYPPENLELADTILERRGAHITEMPFGWVPRGRDFPRRNRIISGLSLGVIVVEAAVRSGSLITARRAAEHGRLVFSVPGSPLDPRAAGSNQLIKDGAQLVTEIDDIISALEPMRDKPPIEVDEDGREDDDAGGPFDVADAERDAVWRPRCLSFLSLLLCLRPSGGDRGPQAQKPPKREPLYIGNARLLHFLGLPPLGLPLSGSGSAASGVPAAFPFPLSFSACGPLAGTGARKPKSHPNERQSKPSGSQSLLLLSGRPLSGTGPPIYRQRPSVALPGASSPWASSLWLWLCCFWRPRCLSFLSLLLCLRPSGGDRGPQAQKPPKREPLYIGNARLLHFLGLPPLGLPLSGSGSAASGVPVAFPFPLSFSACGPLAGTGARKPKSHPNERQSKPSGSQSFLLLSGRPLPGTGPPIYIGNARLLHFLGLPPLGLPLSGSGSAASGVPVAFPFPLSSSACGPLAGTGARKPKSHPSERQSKPSGSQSLLLLSGRPLAGNGAPYI